MTLYNLYYTGLYKRIIIYNNTIVQVFYNSLDWIKAMFDNSTMNPYKYIGRLTNH